MLFVLGLDALRYGIVYRRQGFDLRSRFALAHGLAQCSLDHALDNVGPVRAARERFCARDVDQRPVRCEYQHLGGCE